MITPAEIKIKATNFYPKMIRAWLHGESESLFPYRMPVILKIPQDHAEAIRVVNHLRDRSKSSLGFGYTVQWQRRQMRQHGANDIPVAVTLDTLDDVVRLIGKRQEFDSLQRAVKILRESQPLLNDWLCESTHWKDLVEAEVSIDGLLAVTDYFCHNPRPDCFAREIPLRISTKLIEQHRTLLAQWFDRLLPPGLIDTRYSPKEFDARYGLRYARNHFLLRVLDESLRTEIGIPFTEFSLPAQELSSLAVVDSTVYLIENKVNLLTFPAKRRGIALGGLGNGITQLSEVAWLKSNPIYYWGDLDFEGFEILSRLRRFFPHVVSIHMDQATWDEHRDIAIQGNPIKRSMPEHLTAQESELCHFLMSTQQRLEQERIPQSWINAN